MDTGYELLLPEGLLDYFEVVHTEKTSSSIILHLDEKDLSQEERKGDRYESKGFYPCSLVHDFPVRGKSLLLHVRRRWVNLTTGNPFMRDWEVVVLGKTYIFFRNAIIWFEDWF